MRVFIPAVVLALTAFWPRIVCAERGTTEQPPVITIKWTGLVPAINLDSDPGDALFSASNPLLVIVIVKGEYRLVLSAGHETKAETETNGGVAVFSLPVDFPLQRNLTIEVRSRSYWTPPQAIPLFQLEPDLIPNALAKAGEECNFVFRHRVRTKKEEPSPAGIFFSYWPEPRPMLPESVDVIVVPVTDVATPKEWPGFAGKFVDQPQTANVLHHFSLELTPTTDFTSCFWDMECGEAYFTRPFSLKSAGPNLSRFQPLPDLGVRANPSTDAC
jgi:hypothetical protein